MDNSIIVPIVAPELHDSNYGEKINEQFDNINRNFESLSSLPFLRGEKGDSIKLLNVKLDIENTDPLEVNILDGRVEMTPSYICSKILEYSALGVNDNLQVGGVSRGDLLNDSYITLLYYTENGKNILSSIHPYVFKDARFYNISNENLDDYVDVLDTSCIVCYQEESGDGWTILSNIPKLYYDKKLKTFCWKLNGSETGILATGPKGEPGTRGNLRLVTISVENDDKTTYPIENVAVTEIVNDISVIKFEKYTELKSRGEVEFSEGDAVVVFADPSSPGYADKGHYWIALITTINGTEYVTISNDLSVQGYDAQNGFIQSMKSIGSPEAGSVGLNGLFIPVSTSSTESHIFYSKDGELRMSVVKDGVSTDGLIESNDGKLYINYDIESRSFKSPEIVTSTLKVHPINNEEDSLVISGNQLEIANSTDQRPVIDIFNSPTTTGDVLSTTFTERKADTFSFGDPENSFGQASEGFHYYVYYIDLLSLNDNWQEGYLKNGKIEGTINIDEVVEKMPNSEFDYSYYINLNTGDGIDFLKWNGLYNRTDRVGDQKVNIDIPPLTLFGSNVIMGIAIRVMVENQSEDYDNMDTTSINYDLTIKSELWINSQNNAQEGLYSNGYLLQNQNSWFGVADFNDHISMEMKDNTHKQGFRFHPQYGPQKWYPNMFYGNSPSNRIGGWGPIDGVIARGLVTGIKDKNQSGWPENGEIPIQYYIAESMIPIFNGLKATYYKSLNGSSNVYNIKFTKGQYLQNNPGLTFDNNIYVNTVCTTQYTSATDPINRYIAIENCSHTNLPSFNFKTGDDNTANPSDFYFEIIMIPHYING